ncbi:LAMI_0F02432g1_1 [Lachancea mirantina]|uniref:LAMI_0F02432g1_1 n=1 Tax=Lachancea mirantina TaxID=1230905 RepID=A0A1G4JWU1_9SACH|nr:LAMI_0F02432g1_1 [Lachancea mirantina]
MSDGSSRLSFRDYQLTALNSFVNPSCHLAVDNLIIHGQRSSGKSYTLQDFFGGNPRLLHSWLNVAELVTWKPLLQHVAKSIADTLKKAFHKVDVVDQDALEAEDFFLLIKFLQINFKKYDFLEHDVNLFVVLDGFDQLQELDFELFPKFLKLHEALPSGSKIHLRFIYTIQSSAFVSRYRTYLIPTIVFPRYRYDEVMAILLKKKAKQYAESETLLKRVLRCGIDPEDTVFEQIVENYIRLTVQAFHSYTGNDPVALEHLLDCKWESYTNEITAKNVTEPVLLYKSNLSLYLSTGETLTENTEEQISENEETATSYELSLISKYLLMSAYLCSYLDPRYDSKIFSKKSHLRAGRSSYGRRNKMRMNPRYLQPSLFPLERLLSIFQAIFPLEGVEDDTKSFRTKEYMRSNVEVYENLAELNTLKLIMTAAPKNVDYLSYKIKWKINVPWEIIKEIASTIDFDIAGYFSDLHN